MIFHLEIRPGTAADVDGGLVVVHPADEHGQVRVDVGRWLTEPSAPVLSLTLGVEERDQLAAALVNGIPGQ